MWVYAKENFEINSDTMTSEGKNGYKGGDLKLYCWIAFHKKTYTIQMHGVFIYVGANGVFPH